MTDSVEDNLNGALRRLIDDLRAERPTSLTTFKSWCTEHSEDIMLKALIDEVGPLDGLR